MCSHHHRRPHFELVTNGERDFVRFTKTAAFTAAFTEADLIRRELPECSIEIITVCN